MIKLTTYTNYLIKNCCQDMLSVILSSFMQGLRGLLTLLAAGLHISSCTRWVG